MDPNQSSAEMCISNLLSDKKQSMASLQNINSAPNQPQFQEGLKIFKKLGKLEFKEMMKKYEEYKQNILNEQGQLDFQQQDKSNNNNQNQNLSQQQQKKPDLNSICTKFLRIKRLKTDENGDTNILNSIQSSQLYEIQSKQIQDFELNDEKEEDDNNNNEKEQEIQNKQTEQQLLQQEKSNNIEEEQEGKQENNTEQNEQNIKEQKEKEQLEEQLLLKEKKIEAEKQHQQGLQELDKMIKLDEMVKKRQQNFKLSDIDQASLQARQKQQTKIIFLFQKHVTNLKEFVPRVVEVLKAQVLFTNMGEPSRPPQQMNLSEINASQKEQYAHIKNKFQQQSPYYYFMDNLFKNAIENTNFSWETESQEQYLQFISELFNKISKVQKGVIEFIVKIYYEFLQKYPDEFDALKLPEEIEVVAEFLVDNRNIKCECLESLLQINNKQFFKSLLLTKEHNSYGKIFLKYIEQKLQIICENKRNEKELKISCDLTFAICMMNQINFQKVFSAFLQFPTQYQEQTLSNFNQKDRKALNLIVAKIGLKKFDELVKEFQKKVAETDKLSYQNIGNLLEMSELLIQGSWNFYLNNNKDTESENLTLINNQIAFHINDITQSLTFLGKLSDFEVTSELLMLINIDILQDFDKTAILEKFIPEGEYLKLLLQVILQRTPIFLQQEQFKNLIQYIQNMSSTHFIEALDHIINQSEEQEINFPQIVMAAIIKGKQQYEKILNEKHNQQIKLILEKEEIYLQKLKEKEQQNQENPLNNNNNDGEENNNSNLDKKDNIAEEKQQEENTNNSKEDSENEDLNIEQEEEQIEKQNGNGNDDDDKNEEIQENSEYYEKQKQECKLIFEENKDTEEKGFIHLVVRVISLREWETNEKILKGISVFFKLKNHKKKSIKQQVLNALQEYEDSLYSDFLKVLK